VVKETLKGPGAGSNGFLILRPSDEAKTSMLAGKKDTAAQGERNLFISKSSIDEPMNKSSKSMTESGSAGSFEELKELSGYPVLSAEFQSQMNFYLQAARLSWSNVPPRRLAAQSISLKKFSQKMLALLDKDIEKSMYTENYANPSETTRDRIRNRFIFQHTVDTITALGKAAIMHKKEGVVALAASLQDWAEKYLSPEPSFFTKPMDSVVREYMDAEPRLVALAQITGKTILPIQEGAEAAKASIVKRTEAVCKDMAANLKEKKKPK